MIKRLRVAFFNQIQHQEDYFFHDFIQIYVYFL